MSCRVCFLFRCIYCLYICMLFFAYLICAFVRSELLLTLTTKTKTICSLVTWHSAPLHFMPWGSCIPAFAGCGNNFLEARQWGLVTRTEMGYMGYTNKNWDTVVIDNQNQSMWWIKLVKRLSLHAYLSIQGVFTYIRTHTHIYIYIHMYMCVWACYISKYK